ncbi:MAG: hypothetical protein JNK40_03930 [Chromatiales bacterium]|nr:hypothetical protein [Chromatiales bacterium]
MLQRGMLGSMALLGLLAGATANADDRRHSSEPQIRLGIDILWGGYGPVYAAPPPVVYYPPHYAPPPVVYYPPRYAYDRGYDRGYEEGYDRAKWRGNGHKKHGHRKHRHDD